ncbi:MAG: hypothetical protein H7Y12_15690 [Sphingobacteriaceae bacterium]|nr:hypothetical protein [Cytophagaceae bacterium]
MKKALLFALPALLTAGLLLTACQKNDLTSADSLQTALLDDLHQTTAAEDEVATIYDDSPMDFFTMTTSEESNTLKTARDLPIFCGATITTTRQAGGGFTTVVDYGAGQTCQNGKTRKGKITTVFAPGTGKDFIQTITFENYSVDGRTLNGTQTVTLVGGTPGGVVKTKVEKMILTTKDGKTITFSSEKTRSYDRKGTLSPSDDEISVTGSSSGTGSEGKAFTSAIKTPVLIRNSCGREARVPVAGVVEITPAGGSTHTVDYGDGTCDNTYTVTVGGKTETKTFK